VEDVAELARDSSLAEERIQPTGVGYRWSEQASLTQLAPLRSELLKKVLDEVVENHDVTLVKRRDAEDAVILSLSDYNAMQETLHLLSTPANARRLAESMTQLKKRKAKPRTLSVLRSRAPASPKLSRGT
jgi:antitoxin YefM